MLYPANRAPGFKLKDEHSLATLRRKSDHPMGIELPEPSFRGRIAPMVSRILDRAADVIPLENAARKAQSALFKETLVLERLVRKISESQPTSFAEAWEIYFKAFTNADNLEVYFKRGDGTYRGILRIARVNDSINSGGIQRHGADLDVAGGILTQMAIDLDRVMLRTGGTKGKIYWVDRNDRTARVHRERIDTSDETSVLIAPFNTGVCIVTGQNLTFGPIYPHASATRMTSDFTHIVRMDQESKTDPLTGLITRREYVNTLRYFAEEHLDHGVDHALLMSDVDRFRDYNNTYGHSAGDRVLIAVSRIAQQTFRTCDRVAGGSGRSGGLDIMSGLNAFRIGGEEMTILVAEADTLGGAIAGDRFRLAVGKEVVLDDQNNPLPGVTVSVGVVSMSQIVESLRKGAVKVRGPDAKLAGKAYEDMTREEKVLAIVEAAPILVDKAVYRAKDDGRNCVYTVRCEPDNGSKELVFERFKGKDRSDV